MVDMGPISLYLGLKVEQNRTNKTIKLSQPVYLEKLPARFYLHKAYVVDTLMKEMFFF